uniref:Hypothetical conserved protein n=1 Tax=uncultured Chloroflexota bacterium TaxID=166587 RepID=H5SN29_9CHLR|nr:hypothetical conserved protein [uncultured Chloroflexota bacterium]
MVTEDELIQVKRNPWVDNFFRPVLITIMIMSFNYSLVSLVRLINPAWRGFYFLLGMLLTTVEALYSYRVLKHWRSRGISMLRYRLAEWVVLMVILKLLSFADKPLAVIKTHLQAMWQDPANLLDFEYYVLLMLAMVAWLAATDTIADFEALYDPYTDRTIPMENLATRFFWGGVLLMLNSGLSQWILRAGVSSLIDFDRPSLSGIVVNVLLYFVLGLVLLSQARLTILLVRWQVERITVASNLARQWARYGLIFLGLIGLIVLTLPTGYTLGFLASAAIVVQFLFQILLFILQLILFLLSLPILLLLSLLGQPAGGMFSPPPPPVLPERPPPGDPLPWLAALRSLIFWLLTLAIVWYLLKIYLDDHPGLLAAIRRVKPIAWLINLIGPVWQWLWALAQLGLDMVPKRIEPDEESGSLASKATRLWPGWFRRLSPREQILYYYLNILQRAARLGAARQSHQTPYEYEPELQQIAPQAQAEIHQLTGVFVRARYSQDRFTRQQATLVRWLWRQIRRVLGQKQAG